MKEVIFAGNGHTGIAAFISLQSVFEKIYVLSACSEDVINLRRENDPIINNFSDVGCQYVFLCAYAPLITAHQLSKKVYINTHGALLPKYRGMQPTFWAIMNGERELGVSFHLVDEYMDSGDILAQYSFEYNGQPVAEVNDILDKLILEHAGQVVSDYISGNVIPVKQDDSKATYCAKRNLNDCLVDLTWNIDMIHNFFRALTPPYPLPRVRLRDVEYEITEYHLIERLYFGPLGRVVNIDREGLWIKVNDGFLVISGLRNVSNGIDINPRYIVPIGYRIIHHSGG